MVKSLVQKTLTSPMDKNEDSEKLVLNMVFDNKKEMDYISKLLHNQEIPHDFRSWMDDASKKQIARLREKLFLLDLSLTITLKIQTKITNPSTIQKVTHLNSRQREMLYNLLIKYKGIFDGKLG